MCPGGGTHARCAWHGLRSLRAALGLTLPLVFACSHCIQQILEAALHCHQMGVVHRDLKVSDGRPTGRSAAVTLYRHSVAGSLCGPIPSHQATHTRALATSPLSTGTLDTHGHSSSREGAPALTIDRLSYLLPPQRGHGT